MDDKVNILLVDDQPAKLLSYETILEGLGENLIKAASAPEVLRAKVKIFAELYRKTRQLEQLNRELERRVAERTAELEASTTGLVQSEQRRSLALAGGRMGSWDWDPVAGHFAWDDGQYRIFGVDPESFALTIENIRALIHPDDWSHLQ